MGKITITDFDPSRSSKVIEFGTIGKPVYKFLLVFLTMFFVAITVSKLFRKEKKKFKNSDPLDIRP